MRRTKFAGLVLLLACSPGAGSATEETGGDPFDMPEWEDGAPGSACPDEYDPDRVYVTMQRTRFQWSAQWLIRDAEAQDVECSYRFEKNDFLDIFVHPGRRTPVLSMETPDGIELRLPQPDPLRRSETIGEAVDWVWDFAPAYDTDTSLFELEDDQTSCGDTLRRWWPDATVTFYCSHGWFDEIGIPRFEIGDFDAVRDIFTLSGPRVLLFNEIHDPVASAQQGIDYVPIQLDYGTGSSKRVLHARTLTSGTRDAILVQSRIPCAECPTGEDLVLNRYLVAGGVIEEERGYIWPREIELEVGQVVLDGEGRWVAHVQEPAPDGRMFERVIRGEPNGSETVLLDAPLLVEDVADDPTAIRIARVFTGA